MLFLFVRRLSIFSRSHRAPLLSTLSVLSLFVITAVRICAPPSVKIDFAISSNIRISTSNKHTYAVLFRFVASRLRGNPFDSKQTSKNSDAIRIATQTTSQRRAGKGKRYKRLSRYHLSGRGTLYSMVLALQGLCSSAFHHGSLLSDEKTGETKAVCLEQKRRRKFYLAGRARRRDEFRVSPPSPLLWPKNCGGEALENVAPGNKTNPGVARSVSVLRPLSPAIYSKP